MEPGLYWATVERPHMRSYEAVMQVFTDGEMEEQWPSRQMFSPGCGVVIGPRIPTAEELGEWTNAPRCPDCSAILSVFDIDTWMCPNMDCRPREKAKIYKVETRYRVVEETCQ